MFEELQIGKAKRRGKMDGKNVGGTGVVTK